MRSLLVISSAPARMVEGRPYLDKKFVEGMRLYADLWDGPVGCLLKTTATEFPFGQIYEIRELPFDVKILPEDRTIQSQDMDGYHTLLCSGDSHEHLHIPDLAKPKGVRTFFIIEYIPETRHQIIFLDRSRTLPRKLYSLLWTLNQERRRRRAFRLADGLQANGYPAFEAYRHMNGNTLLYLDSRIREDLLATPAEMEARQTRLLSGAPLRLLHSGRLEPMKGSQDLIPVARHLVSRGVDFELDIFGYGSLESEIRDGITRYALNDRVRLHAPVDFETELVPFARANADLYLSCHRQSDPSCTYLESMGCGLAVVGYANRMWSALCRESGSGWSIPMGRTDALAETIAKATIERPLLKAKCQAALHFAASHSFEREFNLRIKLIHE